MALTRVKDTDIETKGHQSVSGDSPDITDEDKMKVFFDKLPTFIATTMNANSTALEKQTTTSGAEIIGCSAIDGVNIIDNIATSGTLREMLVDLKSQIDGFLAAITGEGELILPDRSISEEKLKTTAVASSKITGYVLPGSASVVSAADEVAVAFGKLQRYINNILNGTLGVDTAENYATGGTIESGLVGKQDTLLFDSTPTAASVNPVTSAGVKTYVDGTSILSSTATVSGSSTDVAVTKDLYMQDLIAVYWLANNTTKVSFVKLYGSTSNSGALSLIEPTVGATTGISTFVVNWEWASTDRDKIVFSQPKETAITNPTGTTAAYNEYDDTFYITDIKLMYTEN